MYPRSGHPERFSTGKRAAFTAVAVLLSLVLFELGSFVAIGVLMRKGWMAYIPRFTDAQIETYFEQRDPWLGWAFTSDSTWGQATDSTGHVNRPRPRRDPSPGAVGAPCVSVYGDSFAFGAEVEDSAAFPHYLGGALGCPVRNFGVPGYGSDQALMLFRAQAGVDSAPVVIFQHLTENVLRNVNRYANLLYPGSPLRFKPRFVTRSDSLHRLDAPVATRSDFARVGENPDSALAPDGLLDRPRAGFPFTVALVRWLATDMKIRARLTGVPVEAAYYEPDHPAAGLELTVAILAASVRDAANDGRRAVILLQATRQALIHARSEGVMVDEALYEALRRRGLPVIHAGPAVLAVLGPADPCTLFDECSQTHFNAAGNRIIADLVANYLRAEALAGKPAPTGAASAPAK